MWGQTYGNAYGSEGGRLLTQNVSGTLSFNGQLVKVTQVVLSGILTMVGQFSTLLPNFVVQALSATLLMTGQTSRSIHRTLVGSLGFIGTSTILTVRFLRATLSFVGTTSHQTIVKLIAGLTFTGRLIRSSAHNLSGQLSFTSTYTRSLKRTLLATLTPTGKVFKSMHRTLPAASLSFGGLMKRLPMKRLVGTLRPIANLKLPPLTHILNSTLGFTTSLGHQSHKNLRGALTMVGQVTRIQALRGILGRFAFVRRLNDSTFRFGVKTSDSDG